MNGSTPLERSRPQDKEGAQTPKGAYEIVRNRGVRKPDKGLRDE